MQLLCNFEQKCLFLAVLVEKTIYYEEIFLQFCVSFNFVKSIKDDAIVDITMMLSIKGQFVICFRSAKYFFVFLATLILGFFI